MKCHLMYKKLIIKEFVFISRSDSKLKTTESRVYYRIGIETDRVNRISHKRKRREYE